MKNLFNNLTIEQMAQLLKKLITSGNGEFSCTLNNGKLHYSMSGDLDLIPIIEACEKAVEVKKEVKQPTSRKRELEKEIEVIESRLNLLWENNHNENFYERLELTGRLYDLRNELDELY